jgi:hypothetical protein
MYEHICTHMYLTKDMTLDTTQRTDRRLWLQRSDSLHATDTDRRQTGDCDYNGQIHWMLQTQTEDRQTTVTTTVRFTACYGHRQRTDRRLWLQRSDSLRATDTDRGQTDDCDYNGQIHCMLRTQTEDRQTSVTTTVRFTACYGHRERTDRRLWLQRSDSLHATGRYELQRREIEAKTDRLTDIQLQSDFAFEGLTLQGDEGTCEITLYAIAVLCTDAT